MGYVFRPISPIFLVSLDAEHRVATLCDGIHSDREADPTSTLLSRSPAELVQFLKPNARDYQTGISDSELSHLAGLGGLKVLDPGGTAVSADGVAGLLKLRRELEVRR
jgi:hypothetical protein